MKKSTILLLHAGYWVTYVLLVTCLYFLPLAAEDVKSALNEDLLIALVSAVLPGVISFYLFYFRLVPRLLAKRNIKRFLLGGIVASLVAGLAPTLLSSVILYRVLPASSGTKLSVVLELAPMLLLGFTFLALVNGALGTVFSGFITWYAEIRVREALEKKNLETRLDLLKAQLNPHFLFNTLNNIDVLIRKDPAAASRYLNSLSDLLRFMLYESPRERVPLGRELHFIRQYLDLQKIRSANEQFVECSITGTADHLSVAPLLFMPFIENAFKYATNKKITGGISLQFDIGENEISFTCRNAYKAGNVTPPDRGGLGLPLIRQRLELLYKDQHTLHIHQTEDTYAVELRLQLRETPRKETAHFSTHAASGISAES